MREFKYRLEGHEVVPETDLMRWAKWMEHRKPEDIIVKQEERAGIRISTVFLGLDYIMGDEDGEPQVFETMIFAPDANYMLSRYSSWEQAEAGHKLAVELVEKQIKQSETVRATLKGAD